jgi:hypothetical protein
MRTEVPAGQMLAHLERAAFALRGSSVGVQADIASVELLAALDVALKHKDAPIVPNLARKLEETKEQVDQGSYSTALDAIDECIDTVSSHESLRTLERMAKGIRGAREAMERDAGLVVIAELDQLSELANEFNSMLKAAPALAETDESALPDSEESAGADEVETSTAETPGARGEEPVEAAEEGLTEAEAPTATEPLPRGGSTQRTYR